MKCSECDFFEYSGRTGAGSDVTYGVCHLNPPQFAGYEIQECKDSKDHFVNPMLWAQPLTLADSWCSHLKPKIDD